jgi:hypothetical protein
LDTLNVIETGGRWAARTYGRENVMRYKVLAFGALAVASVCGPVGTATAQVASPVGPVTQPSFSPYLNLLRRDNPTYLNYYGLVRPQQDFRQSIQTLRQDVNNVYQSQQQAADQTSLPGTGHRTAFLNTMGYFMNTSGGPGYRQGIPVSAGATRPGGAPGQAPVRGGSQGPRPGAGVRR